MIPFSLKVACYRTLMAVLKVVVQILPMKPPLLFTGPGSSRQLAAIIGQTETKRLLIVTDKALVALGVLDGILEELESQGVTCTLYDGVQPDPPIAQIEEGLRTLQENRCEAVLAVGGGSSIDAAKIIAARATNDKPVVKMAGLFRVYRTPLPIFAVPTTAGTGSEITVGAVVSDPDARAKLVIADLKLMPRMAALDGELMRNLPAPITAATGMDALTHAVEAYVSRNALRDTDAMALAATRLILTYLPRAVENGAEDIEARQQMSLAAFYAGYAITKVGVGYVHAIAHKVGALYHVPHGRANATVMPYVLDYSKGECAARLADLAVAGGLGKREEGAFPLAERFIQHIRDLNRQFGIDDKLLDLKKEDIPLIVESAIAEARFTYAVPRYMDVPDCERVVRQMLPA